MLPAEDLKCWGAIALDSDYFMYYDNDDTICVECVFEAWEHMTYGGVVVRRGTHTDPTGAWWPRWLPPYVGEAKDGYTEYVAR